jgi:hypothetical protein
MGAYSNSTYSADEVFIPESTREEVKMEIGNHVIYVDEFGSEHSALVTAIWQGAWPKPSLNVVYVSGDKNATDQYGRQLAERATSVVHEDSQPAHGRKWREVA